MQATDSIGGEGVSARCRGFPEDWKNGLESYEEPTRIFAAPEQKPWKGGRLRRLPSALCEVFQAVLEITRKLARLRYDSFDFYVVFLDRCRSTAEDT